MSHPGDGPGHPKGKVVILGMAAVVALVLVVGLVMRGGGGGALGGQSARTEDGQGPRQAGPDRQPDQTWRQACAKCKSATAGDNKLFVIAYDRYDDGAGLLAFDGRSGKQLWTTDVGGDSESLDLHGDLVLVSDENGEGIEAVDAATGKKRWSASGVVSEHSTDTLLAILIDGVRADSAIVDAATGKKEWSAPGRIKGICERTVILLGSTGSSTLYDASGVVSGYDLSTGKQLWTHPASPNSDVRCSSDGAFVSDGKMLSAYGLASGKKLWSDASPDLSSLGAGYGWVLTAKQRTVRALRASDGQVAWSKTVPALGSNLDDDEGSVTHLELLSAQTVVAVEQGRIGDTDRTLALQATDGKQLGSVPGAMTFGTSLYYVELGAGSSPAANAVYGYHDDRLHAYDSADLSSAWKGAIELAISSLESYKVSGGIAIADGRVYVVAGNAIRTYG